MSAGRPADFPVLKPSLQVAFYHRLESTRNQWLRSALKGTLRKLSDLRPVDEDLRIYAPKASVKRLAEFGIRGEVVFATPTLLELNPFLLGYYRLLYGFSQKEFYNKGPFGRFKKLEERGDLGEATRGELPRLCRSLASTAALLIEALDPVSEDVVHELQLLTLGPMLRGSENTKIGNRAAKVVFELIKQHVEPSNPDVTKRSIRLANASGRSVLLEFGSDPDIRVTEKLQRRTREVLSVEIKGGADRSNIHNRLGEAEKSHLKAKRLGCSEFWTILQVHVEAQIAHQRSPTTTRFFHLQELCSPDSPIRREFLEELSSRLGIS